jgi:hypothetical protein
MYGYAQVGGAIMATANTARMAPARTPRNAGKECGESILFPLGSLAVQILAGFERHKNGAEDEIRTRDLLLGKEMLYH